MLKILSVVTLMVVSVSAYAMDSAYNPSSFRMSKEEHVGKIIKEQVINPGDIKESLSFLDTSSRQSLAKEYSAESFQDLLSKAQSINHQNKSLQSYLENCSQIYSSSTTNPTTQEAVFRLLKAVTGALEAHYADIQAIERTLHPQTAFPAKKIGSSGAVEGNLQTSPHHTLHKRGSSNQGLGHGTGGQGAGQGSPTENVTVDPVK